MIEKIDLEKKLTKKEYHSILEEWSVKLASLQRSCKELKIPIIIVFEGWGASGKGTLINQLIRPLDPRGFQVFTTQQPSEEERMRPFLWRFWTKLPEHGRIHIFDRSWYQRLLKDQFDNKVSKQEVLYAFDEILNYEEQLADDGAILIKFFLHISKEEQTKRFRKLEKSPETAWRVTRDDWKHNEKYDKNLRIIDEVLIKTDTDYAPWTIVESTDREYAASKILTTVAKRLQEAVNQKKAQKPAPKEKIPAWVSDSCFKNGVLNGIDLSKTIEKAEYKKKLEKLQARLAILHNKMYQERIPVILAFEGWDAGGKGGAIKRITENIDPRGYEVVPTAAPNDIEKAHHYLWRFWNKVPKAGHLAIFDRTWYGRVMVERIEGFCTEEEWKRAYNEINHMEEHLANFGCIVIKFWMHIDKEEQERRFKERQETPEKQWKITDEDWRNREKWDQYEEAVDEMILRTSTAYAPWVIVEANSKYYARIKVLETVVKALEKRLG